MTRLGLAMPKPKRREIALRANQTPCSLLELFDSLKTTDSFEGNDSAKGSFGAGLGLNQNGKRGESHGERVSALKSSSGVQMRGMFSAMNPKAFIG